MFRLTSKYDRFNISSGTLLNSCFLLAFNSTCKFSSFLDSTESFYDKFLKSCDIGFVSLKQIHASLVTLGIIAKTPHLGAQTIIRYAKLGDLNSARSVFDRIHGDKPNSFLWNTTIRAYACCGHYVGALELYSIMRRTGISSNNYTFPFVLKACASLSLIVGGKVVHGEAIKTGFDLDLYVEAALVDMYAKCGQIEDGCKIFDKMPIRDLVCWTAMITAYEQAEQPDKALVLFQKMQQAGVSADAVSIVNVASAVGQLGDAIKAQIIHSYAICVGFLEDIFVGNAIITMYAKCGNVGKARLVFDLMDERDGISWNSMLSGYTQNGQASEAFKLFDEMLDSGCKPNPVTVLIMISACTYVGSCHLGRKLHNFIMHNKIEVGTTLQIALMDMYAKCGDLDTALRMFSNINPSEHTVSLWNVLISGYGMHGYGKQALELFLQMKHEGIEPDHVTFTSVLSICSHAGLIEEGRKCLAEMRKHCVTPQVKHYACMVDMLGRAGLLSEAFDLIKEMPSPPSDSVWGALLLACKIHGNTQLGEIAAKNLFQLEPEHAGYHVLVSNIYAASNKWQEVEKLREDMKNKGLRKPAAVSVI